ncbi:GlxA family transcriptional regulator [Rhizobium tubonense]|uniref:AraC family transcriptional regulator n=1 Tax=Rhizobium tubonense TaxID=484088 RepID=A0A2W4CIT4_9HYPH|nr:GlxA family transcriptional regulator [Rhizobium tubonense]PZM10918.1 AraC family transcriptional regulator [Rhizobium tubonense]
MLAPSNEPLDIDLLVLPETNLILIASVIEPLRGANRIVGSEIYRWRIFTPDGAPADTTSRIPVPAHAAFRPEKDRFPLFVLGSYNWRRSATSALKMQLSKTARHRSMIAGIESGSWLLAEASLLDNFSATTHWEDFEEFAAAYPQVRMIRDRFVIDGKRITTGGSLPTLDLMLEIIRRRQGYSLALEVTRLFIYEQGSAQVMPSTAGLRMSDTRVAHAVRLMEDNVEQPIVLARLAKRVGVSARHLQTLFQEGMGVAPHVHYLALRLNAARRKVIETRATFADIAAATGFNSASAFSRSYRAHFSESASDTRKRLRRRTPDANDRPQ